MTRTRARRKFPWMWVIPAAALIGAGAFFWQKSQTSKASSTKSTVETVKVSRGDFRLSNSGPGTLGPRQSVDLAAKISGTIQSIATLGDRVSKGQVLAQLDPTDAQRAVDNTQLALSKAQTQYYSTQSSQSTSSNQQQQSISNAKGQLTTARAQFATAQANFTANQKLYKIGGISSQTLEDARNSLQQAQIALNNANIGLQTAQQNLTGGQTSNDQNLKNLQLAIQQAKLSLQSAKEDFEKTKVRAPFSGVVSSVSGQVGQTATGPLLTLIDDSAVVIPVQIDETEIGNISLGQKAEVTLDAIDGKSFPGKVKSIAPSATVVQNIAVFSVSVEMDNSRLQFKTGMTAEADIIKLDIPNAILVPLRAVTQVRNRGFVQVQGEPEERRVRVGPNDGVNIVVTSGLEPGEILVLPARATPTNSNNSGGGGGGIRLPIGGGGR